MLLKDERQTARRRGALPPKRQKDALISGEKCAQTVGFGLRPSGRRGRTRCPRFPVVLHNDPSVAGAFSLVVAAGGGTGHLITAEVSFWITSWAPPSTMLVADTRVSTAFSCSSGMDRAPQLHMVDRTLLRVMATLSFRVPA